MAEDLIPGHRVHSWHSWILTQVGIPDKIQVAQVTCELQICDVFFFFFAGGGGWW